MRLPIAVLALLLGCEGTAAGVAREAIVEGTIDDVPEVFPGVVSIALAAPEGTGSCTGALVAADVTTGRGVVLTAAHCFFGRLGDAPAEARRVVVGPDAATGRALTTGRVWIDPAFARDTFTIPGAPLDPVPSRSVHDVAALEVFGIDAEIAARVMSPPAAGDPAPAAGATLRTVGFGSLAPGATTTLRHRGEAPITFVARGDLTGATVLVVDEASGGGPCYGDSGGPGLVGDAIVGVSSEVIYYRPAARCRELATYAAAAESVDDVLAPALAGLPGPAPTSCASCTRSVAGPGGACEAEGLALEDPAYARFATCTSGASFGSCRAREPEGAARYDALRACAATHCAACTPGTRAMAECGGFDPDAAGSCATCVVEGECCERWSRCLRDGACAACEAGTLGGCETVPLFADALRCTEAACPVACAAPLAIYGEAAPPDAGVGTYGGGGSCTASPGGRPPPIVALLALALVSRCRSRPRCPRPLWSRAARASRRRAPPR